MSERKISYLSRTYEDYKQSLIDYTKKYYPEISNNLTDASIGSWLIDLVAVVGDNLSYYIDKAYNETNLDSATKASSIYALARSNGFKVPGPKGSITEVQFTCQLPVGDGGNGSASLGMPSFKFAPIIKKGTRLKANNGTYFETDEDVDFSEQFDENGVSNRTITPIMTSNNTVKYYKVSKTCTATAGISKIYKMSISSNQVAPFMEIIIPETNVMNVESVIFKDGANFHSEPSTEEFMIQGEFLSACDNGKGGTDVYRFFEVNSLIDQYVWGDDTRTGEPVTYKYGFYNALTGQETPTYSVTKGMWKPITQKFITEFTDNGYLKIIFGSGEQVGQDVDISSAMDFSKYQISRMIRNNHLGNLPKDGTTMYVLYRVGGGAASNVAAGTINTITSLNASNKTSPDSAAQRETASAILTSITVTNTIPSVSGKDAPTTDEIKAMVKYNSAAQERCVTVKDYENRIHMMPARYGCPFRVGALEENNKIMIYLLLCNHLGQLSDALPSAMITNIQNYLAEYRTINDFVEIKAGRIVNLSIEADIYVNKNYNAGDVVNSVISKIKEYMDINSHHLGEDIYIGDLQREIGAVDGMLNLIDFRVYNEHDGKAYSQTQISQQTVSVSEVSDYDTQEDPVRSEVDFDASDFILNSDADEMFEIKYPENDIRIRVKTR